MYNSQTVIADTGWQLPSGRTVLSSGEPKVTEYFWEIHLKKIILNEWKSNIQFVMCVRVWEEYVTKQVQLKDITLQTTCTPHPIQENDIGTKQTQIKW